VEHRRAAPHRRFGFGALSLDTAKEVKSAFGVTVNDVVLAICGGALRQYLSETEELPVQPLLASSTSASSHVARCSPIRRG